MYGRLSAADVYKRQALNENNKTAEALMYVNKVRIRANVSPYPNNISKDALREEIYDERRRELSFEGHRWWDLARDVYKRQLQL